MGKYTHLQKGVSRYYAQEPFKALPSAFDDFVGEAVREHLAWQGRDVDACGFVLEDIAECLEVGVAAPDCGMAKLEGGDVCLQDEDIRLLSGTRKYHDGLCI